MFQRNPEKQLIKSCIRGNRQAQFTLYEQHKVNMYNLCLRYAQHQQEAEDMMQEGFFKIFRDIRQYKGEVALSSWMRRVMINSALMHIRKHRKLQLSQMSEEAIHDPSMSTESPWDTEREKAILQMVRKLSDIQQTVFNLKAIDGYNFKEIADMLAGKEATMRSHYLRARTKLQDLLKQELYQDER